MNPYDALGFRPHEAVSPEAVERAYKRAASKAHPDRNQGDTSKMSEINTARDILLNPDRKRRFDELGSTSTGPATTDEMAMQILGNLFSSAVEKAPDYMTPGQIFRLIANEVHNGRAKALEAQRMHPNRLKKARKLMNSVTCAPLMRRAFELRLEKLEREINEINQQVDLGNLMIKLMESVEFK